jgi:hypothetical protein
VIAVALLALATSFCLFDRDEDGGGGHVTALDLCLGMLAVSLAILPLAGLLPVGWAVGSPFIAAYAVALHVPDPPPRPPWLLSRA